MKNKKDSLFLHSPLPFQVFIQFFPATNLHPLPQANLEMAGIGVLVTYNKIHILFLSYRKENAKLIADALEFMYTPWPDNNDEYALRSQLVDLVGDYVFVAPSFETAEMHSTFAPVHVYEFTHRSKLSLFPEWMGVVHGENLVYELGIPMLAGIPLTFDATDRNVSRLFMGVYADFARSATLKVGGVTWEKFNSSHRAYLQLDANPKMAGSYHPHRMAFWNNYYPKLSQVKFEIKTVVASGTSSTATMATLVHVIIAIILATLWLQLYNPPVVRVLYS